MPLVMGEGYCSSLKGMARTSRPPRTSPYQAPQCEEVRLVKVS